MHSNQMSLGDAQPGAQMIGRRDPYRMRGRKAEPVKPPPKASHVSPAAQTRVYAYIEGRFGEYDDTERDFMGDAYADGWAWSESGKPLSAFKPSRFMQKVRQAEILKLFTKGFNDYTEAQNEKAEV